MYIDNMFFIRRNTKNAQLPQTDLLCSTFSSKTGKSEYVESTFDTIKLAKSGIKSARTKILAFSALFLLHSILIQLTIDVKSALLVTVEHTALSQGDVIPLTGQDIAVGNPQLSGQFS